MITANKGEWAEFYVFLKILCDGQLPAADQNLRIQKGRYFQFTTLVWNDPQNGSLKYLIGTTDISVYRQRFGTATKVTKASINSQIKRIFSAILKGRGTFSIPAAEQILHSLERTSLKAPSSEKSDISGEIVDRNTNTSEVSGFSVKSMLKNQATLLNASGQTLFRYELLNLTSSDAKTVSAVTKSTSNKVYVDRTAAIIALGGKFKFVDMSSDKFERTLRRIDTMLPEFLAEMLFGFFAQKGRSTSELVEHLALSNSVLSGFSFKLEAEDYAFKLKQLLAASALGMQPSKVWDGMMRANGGYLVVVPSGEVLCYHAYDRDVFLDYLYNHTAFESPGGRSSPYLNMTVVNGKVFTDLKLQIRFTK